MMKLKDILFTKTFWNHCGWLYIVIVIGLMFLIDHHQAYLNRMNVLKDVEYHLQEFLDNDKPLDRDTLRWALRYYQGLQRYARDNSLYYGDLGFCYYYLGNDEAAIRSYQAAIDLEPRFYMYHYDLGLIYYHQGKAQKALDSFLTALNYINDSVTYFVQIVEVFQQYQGDELNFVAMALIQRAEKDERNLILRLTDIYSRSGEYNRVLSLASQGLRTQKKSWELYAKAGQAAYMLGQYQEALGYLTKAITLEPHALDAYYYRGLSFRKIGRQQAAASDLLRLEQLRKEGITPPQPGWKHDKLHLNIELRVLRQRFG